MSYSYLVRKNNHERVNFVHFIICNNVAKIIEIYKNNSFVPFIKNIFMPSAVVKELKIQYC